MAAMDGWERSLLFGDVEGLEDGGIDGAVRALLEGRFDDALAGLPVECVACVRSCDAAGIRAVFVEKGAEGRDACMVTAIVFLRAFQRENFSGPKLLEDEVEALGAIMNDSSQLEKLEVDGEELVVSTSLLGLLYAARMALIDCQNVFEGRPTAKLWAGRLGQTHHAIITGRSPTIRDQVVASYTSFMSDNSEIDSTIRGLASIELALARKSFLDGLTAEIDLHTACKHLNISVELSGSLAVRTKFQKKPTANLVVQVTSTNSNGSHTDLLIPADALRPANVALDDSDVLGYVKLCEDADHAQTDLKSDLRAVEESAVLAHADIIIGTNASGNLTDEEIRPYVARVLESQQPTPPLLLAKALLLRTRGEYERGRYAERSMQQVEELVNFYSRGNAKDGSVRLLGLEASGYPAFWELQREHAILLGRFGLVKAAAEVFETLSLWDEVIDCHRLMGNVERARSLIEERLETEGQRPRLLCAMGEVTRDDSWFVKAWEASGGRYAKAKRLEGQMLVEKGKYAEAVPCFEDALKVNFLYPEAWFTLAHAAQKIGNNAKVAQALTTAVQLDPGNAEAWNNLGSVQMALGNSRAAVTALQEAAKLKRQSWRVWDNLLTASMACKVVPQIIQALGALVELRGREGVSSYAISLAVDEVVELGSKDSEEDLYKSASLSRQLLQVLGRASGIVSTDPAIWNAYARLHAFAGSAEKEFECRQKEMRALTATSARRYNSEYEAFRLVARAGINMASASKRFGNDEALHSSRLRLKSLLAATEPNFSEEPLFTELKTSLHEIS